MATAPASVEAQQATVLDYLERHGHTKSAAQLRGEIAEGSTPGSSSTPPLQGGGRAVGLDEFADKNAPIAPKGPASAGGPGPGRRRLDNSVAGAQLLTDPPSWEKGYEGMRTFVENVSPALVTGGWTGRE